MAVNSPSGAFNWPAPLAPQQYTAPPASMAHTCLLPADMAVNSPSGAFNWPESLAPQHVAEPLSRMPHENPLPADMAVNSPSGAFNWPESLAPQHVAEPLFPTAQVCVLLADMATYATADTEPEDGVEARAGITAVEFPVSLAAVGEASGNNGTASA